MYDGKGRFPDQVRERILSHYFLSMLKKVGFTFLAKNVSPSNRNDCLRHIQSSSYLSSRVEITASRENNNAAEGKQTLFGQSANDFLCCFSRSILLAEKNSVSCRPLVQSRQAYINRGCFFICFIPPVVIINRVSCYNSIHPVA